MQTNNRQVKMQTNKQIVDEAFDMATSINNVSRTANLYGKLFALKDMQIHLLKEEMKANILKNIEIERKQ